MKKITLPVSRLACLLQVVLCAASMSVSAQGFSPQTQAKLQQVLDNFQNDPVNPYVGGMSAAIKVDGLAFWKGATGHAARNVDAQNNLLPGGTPFTTNTLSQMYSVTKTFTAALTLELAKEGKFSLNAPVSAFLPINAINPTLNGSVTLKQLLAHESGYSDYATELDLQIAVAFQPTKVWTPFEMIYFIHQVKPPGGAREYSSSNYIILGAIIEAVTQKPIQQHFRERFFTPLHLQSMYLSVREQKPAGKVLAAPHDNLSPFNPIFQLTMQPTFPNAYTNISAFPFTSILSLAFTGGGIVTDASDMAEWGSALFGGRATSKATIDNMMNSISPVPDADGDYLGYGVFVTKRISSTEYFIGHDGNAPGYRSVMFYNPDRKLTIAILTNYHGAKLYEVAKALFEALPDFLCGNDNRKKDKIEVCYKGKTHCVTENSAANFIDKGAYLGSCESTSIPRNGNPIVEELVQPASLTAYPNPASDFVTLSVKVSKAGVSRISIYDMSGKLAVAAFNSNLEKNSQNKITINTAKLSPGTYIVRLENATETTQQKIVIVR